MLIHLPLSFPFPLFLTVGVSSQHLALLPVSPSRHLQLQVSFFSPLFPLSTSLPPDSLYYTFLIPLILISPLTYSLSKLLSKLLAHPYLSFILYVLATVPQSVYVCSTVSNQTIDTTNNVLSICVRCEVRECKAGKCAHSIADLTHAFISLIAALVNMNRQCCSTHIFSFPPPPCLSPHPLLFVPV